MYINYNKTCPQSCNFYLPSSRSTVLKYSWTLATKTLPVTSETANNSPLSDTAMLENTSTASEPWPYGNKEYRFTTPVWFPFKTEYAAVKKLRKDFKISF